MTEEGVKELIEERDVLLKTGDRAKATVAELKNTVEQLKAGMAQLEEEAAAQRARANEAQAEVARMIEESKK